jgi:hypothetical protein
MRHDPLLLEELRAHLLRKREMGDAVAVEMADFALPEREGERAEPTRARSTAADWAMRSGYKFK